MRQMILGTDWWTDCDDAVALRLLSRAHQRGDINLCGIGINACMEYTVASVDGFLHKEGITDMPLGIDLAGTDFGRNPAYQKRLSQYAVRYHHNEEIEDAVRLYRKLLAQATEPVEIIEIGYFQVIANVLKSPADDISDKTGVELAREKVSKIWAMAGKWDGEGEKENNFCRNARTAVGAEAFCRLCPVPVTFLGWEIGFDVITGGNLKEGDVLHDVLVDHGSANGRCSWDPMLVQMALIGDEEKAGYSVVRGRARVDAQSGANYFERSENGPHAFVVKLQPNGWYEQQINALIE